MKVAVKSKNLEVCVAVCEAALGQMPAWPDSSERLLLAGNHIEGRVIYISCTTPQAVEAGSI